MKSVVVGGNLYFMGGMASKGESRNSHTATDKVYSVGFASLLREERSAAKEIKSLGSVRSTPLSHEGCLYALGGKCTEGVASDKILKLRGCGLAFDAQDEVEEEWAEVGTLPQAMWNCVCGVLGNLLLVSGGELNKERSSTSTYQAQLKQTL